MAFHGATKTINKLMLLIMQQKNKFAEKLFKNQEMYDESLISAQNMMKCYLILMQKQNMKYCSKKKKLFQVKMKNNVWL